MSALSWRNLRAIRIGILAVPAQFLDQPRNVTNKGYSKALK